MPPLPLSAEESRRSEDTGLPDRNRTCNPGLEGRCSIQLSYGQTIPRQLEGSSGRGGGIRTPTSCSQSKRATGLRYTPRAANNTHSPTQRQTYLIGRVKSGQMA